MKFDAVAAFTATEQLLDIARAAEEAGLHGVALPDHVFFPEQLSSAYPYAPDGKPFWTSSTPWPDVWVSIGAMVMIAIGGNGTLAALVDRISLHTLRPPSLATVGRPM